MRPKPYTFYSIQFNILAPTAARQERNGTEWMVHTSQAADLLVAGHAEAQEEFHQRHS